MEQLTLGLDLQASAAPAVDLDSESRQRVVTLMADAIAAVVSTGEENCDDSSPRA